MKNLERMDHLISGGLSPQEALNRLTEEERRRQESPANTQRLIDRVCDAHLAPSPETQAAMTAAEAALDRLCP